VLVIPPATTPFSLAARWLFVQKIQLMNLSSSILKLALKAGFICLPLCLSTFSPAAPFGRPAPLSSEEFAKKVEESRKEALLRYPDLGDTTSIFSRAAKVVEAHYRRVKPYEFEDHWNYPLKMAEATASGLRAFSPLDPIFSEVIPILTTKDGTDYPRARVTKVHRDGITIAHDGGTEFIHRTKLTDTQQDKYDTRWSTEVLLPAQLAHLVESAIRERDQNLKVFTTTSKWAYEERLAGAKFDFEREERERGHEFTQASIIRHHCDHFTLRLFELAYAAHEFGQKEAMERIERELGDPVPEPYKTQLKEWDEKIKARNARYEETYALVRGKRCELLRDGQPVREGIPKRGMLGSARFEIPAPEHIRIVTYELNVSSQWVFKLDPKSGEATLIAEASKDEQGATISFRIEK